MRQADISYLSWEREDGTPFNSLSNEARVGRVHFYEVNGGSNAHVTILCSDKMLLKKEAQKIWDKFEIRFTEMNDNSLLIDLHSEEVVS